MATKLRGLNIKELSLVDVPANKGALALLHKRDPSTKEDTVTPEQLAKAQKDAEDLNKRLLAAEEVTKAQAAELEKVQKSNQELAEKLAKADEARAATLRESVAKSMVGTAPVKVEAIAKLLGQTDADGEALIKDLLAKYNALAKRSPAFRSEGTESHEDEDDEMDVEKAQETLEKKAVELQKSNPKLSSAEAMVEASRALPAVYNVAMGR